jgi:hypothetical protein
MPIPPDNTPDDPAKQAIPYQGNNPYLRFSAERRAAELAKRENIAPSPKPIAHQTVVKTMTRSEARRRTDNIKMHLTSIRAELLAIYEAEAWSELDYPNFVSYVKAEFGWEKSHAYRLLDAGQVDRNIFSPMGEKSPELPERQTRELKPYDPEVQRAVYEIARATAPNGKVTAAQLQSVGKVVTELIQAGAMDDGSGNMQPIGTLFTANVTEETYERMLRQQQYITQDRTPPLVKEKAVIGSWQMRDLTITFDAPLTADLVAGDRVFVLIYTDKDKSHD